MPTILPKEFVITAKLQKLRRIVLPKQVAAELHLYHGDYVVLIVKRKATEEEKTQLERVHAYKDEKEA